MDIKQVPGQASQQTIESGKSTAKTAVSDNLQSKQASSLQVNQDDSVEISSLAGNLQKTIANLSSVPDIDTAKVESLKSAIESGAYKIDTANVANKLVGFEVSFTK